ncbi:hypothetical protein RND71_000004 [Anisodus tanguticus]|uniref:DUF4283 domain-containing protein n=1 Tax=Anisodus tanguticus TaxID=243964 RepID=A0AAE1VQZ7_9SOLA|nr:hypothetical protein RND71_000004 [Anisodus tanguticus]
MAIAASGRPPPEVVQPPTTSPTIPPPLDYSKLFKPSVLNHHVFAAGGQNPSSGGGNTTPSQVPFKPITYLHGEPTIRFNKEEIELMINQQDLRFAVVGKFSYGWPEISSLRTSIPKQCELKGEVRIGLLCNRHVLIRCSLFEDYLTLMSKPNWNIQEKGTIFSMRTFKWSTWFDSEEETSLVVTWISLPGLPPTYFGEAQLFSIAAAAGRPLAIDVATKNKTRPSCARVKIEIDLLKEHPKRFQIEAADETGIKSKWYPFRYDFLPKYCTNCKLQGHELSGCWKLHPELMPEKKQGIEKGKEAAAKPGNPPNPQPPTSLPSRQNPTHKTTNSIPNFHQGWVTITNKKHKKNHVQNRKQPNTTVQAAGKVVPTNGRVGKIVPTVTTAVSLVAAGNPNKNPTGNPSIPTKPPTNPKTAHQKPKTTKAVNPNPNLHNPTSLSLEIPTGSAIIPANEATTAPPLTSGNQRKTADSPPETLAGITANPTHFDNPTRPGNPTHLITCPAPSDPPIGNPTGLPKPPTQNHPPPLTQNPKPPSLVVFGSPIETLPVPLIGLPHPNPNPTPPTHPHPPNPSPISSYPSPTIPNPNPSPNTQIIQPNNASPSLSDSGSNFNPNSQAKLNPAALAYNPIPFDPHLSLSPQPCTLNKSNSDIPSASHTRTPSVTSSARRKWCETDGEDVTDEEADGDKVEEEEMEVEEKELGEDTSVDQPGQIVVREKEPSPIAIEAFFERVRTISAKKKKMFEWRCAAEKKKARKKPLSYTRRV